MGWDQVAESAVADIDRLVRRFLFVLTAVVAGSVIATYGHLRRGTTERY